MGRFEVNDLVVRKNRVQVCGVEIEGVGRPVVSVGHCEEYPKGCKSGNWGICLIVVNAVYLGESTCDELSLVFLNLAGRIFLDLENPFRQDDIGVFWAAGARQ